MKEPWPCSLRNLEGEHYYYLCLYQVYVYKTYAANGENTIQVDLVTFQILVRFEGRSVLNFFFCIRATIYLLQLAEIQV